MEQNGIVNPHEHDVLSGRGNFVNYHAGNEHFRALVRKHKVAYVACPKPQKGKFSRMIVDEIRSRNPPGRFLKQDPSTKLWHDIGEKKALDKTRQALREGAPEIMKEIVPGEEGDADSDGAAVQKAVPKVLEVNDTLPYGNLSSTVGHAELPRSSPQMGAGGIPGNPMLGFGGGRLGSGGIPNNYQVGPDLHRKLAGMYQSHDDDYDDVEDQFEPRPIDPRLQNSLQQHLGQQQQQQQQSRRGEFARQSSEASIQVEKVFIGQGDGSSLSKKHDQKMHGSSLSVMSLSMSEFAQPVDGDIDNSNLSDMFSDSVKINDESKRTIGTIGSGKTNRTSLEKSTPSLLDMSVATIGDNMSAFGDSVRFKTDMGESQGNMSFSKVFEDR